MEIVPSIVPLVSPFRLYKHQKIALAKMRILEKPANGIRGGLLFLEMGMGKTLVSLVLAFSSREREGARATLVVAPKSVVASAWKRDGVETFFSADLRRRVLFFHRDFLGKGFDATTLDDLGEYDVVVTTYSCIVKSWRRDLGTAAKGAGVLHSYVWGRIMCDESHNFSNEKTQLYKAMVELKGGRRWCLSGTPLRNCENELRAQFRFLGLDVTRKEWGARRAQDVVSTHIIKMTYESVGIVLPPKTEIVHPVVLSERERECYALIEAKMRDLLDKFMDRLVSYANILAMFTRLRQTCVAAHVIARIPCDKRRQSLEGLLERGLTLDLALLVDGYLEWPSTRRAALDGLQKGSLGTWLASWKKTSGIRSAKIKKVVDIVDGLKPYEKFVIFSSFTSCLDLVRLALPWHIQVAQIDGRVATADRLKAIDRFNTDPDLRGLLLSYKVGADGLNLTAATHCICLEPWWNTAVTQQAQARIYRVGQTLPVVMHTLRAVDTIESRRIRELCDQKAALATKYLGAEMIRQIVVGQ
uniref:DEAD/SNF2-like helicase n=1 Tax=Marseillevirus LCMAC103 TaxID=2506604 RepID=A0A481YUD8_9VIRU|nr:MAG: DEAD/SNF2-like helicase [Marseillevirus LCMAC103]